MSLVDGLALDAVLVLADARTLRTLADDRYVGDVVQTQLQQADVLIVNKADTVDAPQLVSLQAWLGGRVATSSVPVLVCSHARLDIELVLGLSLAAAGRAAAVPGTGRIQRPPDAVELFDSFELRLPQAVKVSAVAAALSSPAFGVLRAKALLRDVEADHEAGTLLQVVAARVDIRAWPQMIGDGQLLAIGLRGRLDHDGLRAALAAAGAERVPGRPTQRR